MTIAPKRKYVRKTPLVRKLKTTKTTTSTNQQRNKVFLDLPSAIKKATFIDKFDCYNIVKIQYHKDFGVINGHNKDYLWFARTKQVQGTEKYTDWQKVENPSPELGWNPSQTFSDLNGDVIFVKPEELIELNPILQSVEKEKLTMIETTAMEMPIYCYIVLDNLELETWYEHDSAILWAKINSETDRNTQKVEIMTTEDLETLSEQKYLLKKAKIKEQQIAKEKWIFDNLEKIKASVEKTILRQKPKTGTVKLSRISDKNLMTQTQTVFSFGQLQTENQIMTSYKLQTK